MIARALHARLRALLIGLVLALGLGGGAHAAEKVGAAAAEKTSAGKYTVGEAAGLHLEPDRIGLKSAVALVIDRDSKEVLFEKNPQAVLPIASITKLMSAMVVLDARQSLDEKLEVTREDVDTEKFSRSRLRTGSVLTRAELLQLALMASENRAATALARQYPGGTAAFVAAMNRKAQALGMKASRFADASGLSPENIANARDLMRMLQAASEYEMIRRYSTARQLEVDTGLRRIQFANTNRLNASPDWHLRVQKTGFTAEAGNCVVLLGTVDKRSLGIVLLDAYGRYSKFGDAHRIRMWLAGKPIAADQPAWGGNKSKKRKSSAH